MKYRHSLAENIKERVLNLLYPRVCPVCGHILTASSRSSENPYICRSCYPVLHIPQGVRCLRCSRPLLDESETLCHDCRQEKRWFDQGVSLLLHDEAARKIIYDLKYHNRRDNADMLAYEAVSRFLPLIRHWKPEVIIPVPLHPARELQRGFNQSAVLAGRLSRFLEKKDIYIPVDTHSLKRVRKTTVQKELNKYQRLANIQGAFTSRELSCSSVLLIDDIFTSGATVSEAARVLKEAGAEKVYFLTASIG